MNNVPSQTNIYSMVFIANNIRIRKMLQLEHVIDDVLTVYNLDTVKIKRKRRDREYFFPRKLISYLSKKFTSATDEQVKEALGFDNHSSVVHHKNDVRDKLRIKDPQLLADIRFFLSKSQLFTEKDFQ